jgi:hypothetical protein
LPKDLKIQSKKPLQGGKVRRKPLFSLVTLALLAAGALSAAEEKPEGKKAPRFKLSFMERIRQESWDNTTGLNDGAADSSAYLRLRTSLGAQWRPGASWEANLRLTNETRYYMAPKADPKLKENYGINELFVDQLNVRWQGRPGLPLTVTVGRQDMQFGEGFLIMDGGALDGSRSAYFNALRLDYAFRAKDALTFFFMRQPRNDTLLPRLNDVQQALTEQEEQGIGLYYAGRLKKTGLEAYLFRKDAFAYGSLPAGAIHVLGARLSHPFNATLSLTGEGALQLGTLGDASRRGLGGYAHLDYKSAWRFPLPMQFTLGGIYLSGDDPASERCESWDPAFSRWPKWSDSLIYLLARETRVADWTNLVSLYATLVFEPLEKVRLTLSGHHLLADQKTGPSALLSGSGRGRGELLIARINYEIGKNFTGRLIWEGFWPGDFYVRNASPYSWVQFEMFFRF